MKKNKEGAINFLNELLKDIPKEEQKEHLEKLIQVMNSLKNLNDNSIFNQLKREEKLLKKDFKKIINIFEENLKYQSELLIFLNLSNKMRINLKDWDRFPLLYTSYSKNILNMIAILNLIKQNLYGSARILLRNTFEALIISKYCFIKKDQELFEKWENGEHINITNSVLNKIQNIGEVIEFKNHLNKYTHYSVYSVQATIEYNSKEITLTLFYLTLLLKMNFTLYYRYLLNQNSLKESIYRYLKNEIYYYEVLYEDTKETLNKLIKSFVHTKKSKLLLKQLDNNWKLK